MEMARKRAYGSHLRVTDDQLAPAEARAYAALAEVLAAVLATSLAAFSRASLSRICKSVSYTLLSNTYCAGR
jgi:hypothetical protein